MIDVVGELSFQSYFFLFFVQDQGVFPITVGRSLLQLGIELYDMLGDFSEFVVGERFDIFDALVPAGKVCKFLKPFYALPDMPNGKISENAHDDGKPDHDP